jgi:antitoxin HicB
MRYSISIDLNDEGGYVAEIPELKGCLSQGETLIETLEELQIVANLWIETAQKHGRKLPNADLAIAKVKILSQ